MAMSKLQLPRFERWKQTYVISTRPDDLRANHLDDQRIYRWMPNHARTKHGVTGEGSSANVNLTGGPPKKMAALQMYVKHYWKSKIKQEVIDKWAPTMATDPFDEVDTGEDDIGWEELTPMEKNIPLWFRMKVGLQLYNAESEEVQAEIDQLREQGKEDAVTARSSVSTFATEDQRLAAMKKYDE
jgi:hypothetical protein